MNLVIVESPTKAKTLSKFLGKDFEVLASMGHVRDLPKSELGVDVDKDFAPKYVINPRAKKVLATIKAKIEQSDKVFLATDPDREGEAIAWHIVSALSKELKEKKSYRVVFHEITKEAVKDAFLHTRDLDEHLVDSQQARRILDRIVGYKLSPLLWKKVRYGLSAGRVQSVAVKLVVDRENERKAFIPKEYWTIKGIFNVLNEIQKSLNFEAELFQIKGKKVEIGDKGKVDEIVKDLGFVTNVSAGGGLGSGETIESAGSSKTFEITSVEKSEKKRNTYPPYTTSALQQAGSNKLGFAAKRTMSAAQKLFEGGYITYHRTDSFSLSSTFIDQARKFISKEYGKDYLPQSPNYYKNRAKNAQEAHEAIRPTSLNIHVDGDLGSDEKKLYKLIWQRALASQMNPAIFDQITILVGSEDKKYTFKTVGSKTKFDGWLVLYKSKETDSKEGLEASVKTQSYDTENGTEMENVINEDLNKGDSIEGKLANESGNETEVLNLLKEGDKAQLNSLAPTQHFTEPLPRYTEASLIKALEEDGIGRPSTYAPTMSTITDRGYIAKDGKYLVPQDVAVVTTKLLSENFPKIVDAGFTALMEEDLDKIADGKAEWIPLIKNFYEPFIKEVKEKDEELKKKDMTLLEELPDKCPECQSVLFVKLGKYGRFISCSGFPKCKYAKPIVSASNAGSGGNSQGSSGDFDKTQLGKCTECKEGDLLVKDGRFGRFIACSNYPKCKFTKPYLERIGVKCPDCKEGDVVVKKGGRFKKTFYACSRYPECKFVASKIPESTPIK